MKNENAQTAYTAFRVMFHLALEQYQPAEHRLIRDDLAGQMLPAHLKWLVKILGPKALRQPFLKLIEKASPGMQGSLLCRKRYIDDKLVEALGAGLEAVVILGAGLDTRAYRLPQVSTRRIYELDLPQTTAYKEKKLQQLFGSIPPSVKLVPIDFDHQGLGDVLKSSGDSLDQKCFFIWEGVTQYISGAAVRAIFEFFATVKPGSRLIFTYIRKDFMDGEMTYGLKRLYQETRVKKQLWKFGLPPEGIAAFVGEFSWQALEQVGADDYRRRYVEPIGRTDPVMEIERAVYAEKTAHPPVR